MLEKNQKELDTLHVEVYDLSQRLKAQKGDGEDVMNTLNFQLHEKSKVSIALEDKIEALQKENDKKTSNITTKFDGKIKDRAFDQTKVIEKAQIQENEMKAQLESLKETKLEKIKYETTITHNLTVEKDMRKRLQESRYAIEIELAAQAKEIELAYKGNLEKFSKEARQKAERNIK